MRTIVCTLTRLVEEQDFGPHFDDVSE